MSRVFGKGKGLGWGIDNFEKWDIFGVAVCVREKAELFCSWLRCDKDILPRSKIDRFS